jgi:hypothetical protein
MLAKIITTRKRASPSGGTSTSESRVTLIGQFLSTPKFGEALAIGAHADLGKKSIKNKEPSWRLITGHNH